MAASARSGRGSVLAEAGRSIGTFVGVAWLSLVVGIALVRGLDVSLAGVPDQGVTIGVLVVAVVATGWLEDGGFERLGANPDGGPRFAWLAIVYLPLTLLPLWVALGLVTETVPVLDGWFVLATTILAVWLAFYGGLERLRLEPADFGRIFVAAVGLAAVPVAAVVLFDVAWLAETRVAVATALVVQCLALWFGLTTSAGRNRGSRQ